MNLLLDTHTILWSIAKSNNLSKRVYDSKAKYYEADGLKHFW
jgi:PIN domain nuclease of toxin-antitoxin system